MHQKRSEVIYQQLTEVIPGGVNSPIRAFIGLGKAPMIVASGTEDTITDVDGNTYIDYCCSWGPLIHGHAHPATLTAITKRMAKGLSFGITTEVEEQLARKVTQLINSIDKIRFVSSGTEATMSAIRLARGYTKRNRIVKFDGNYHGHADPFLIQAGSGVTTLSPTSSSAGIPPESVQHTRSLPYNDLNAVRQLFEDPTDLAAVILEPIAGNMGVVPADREFVSLLRKETERVGALLIFDEVITGFRVGLGGAQEIYGITPDLTCLGKILGGGLPAAAFGGRADIMDTLAPQGPVYQAGTLSGNPITMEAGLETVRLLEEPGVYEELERKTRIITDPVRKFLRENGIKACVQQAGSMFTLFFGRESVKNQDEAKQLDLEEFRRFFLFMLAHGVYVPPSQFEAWFVSTAHTDAHLERTRDLIIEFLSVVRGRD